MAVIVLHGLALLLQVVAAVLSLRLIRITGKSAAWTLLAVAFALVVARRSITYMRFFSMESAALLTFDVILESVILLVISVLQLIGIYLIAPIFLAIRQSESDIKRLNVALQLYNRSLNMLSQVNQVLVRATEESRLLQDVCRIIVDMGGYRMVWIGVPEQDELKTIRPLCHAGVDGSYLTTTQFRWAEESALGSGPAGIAIRSGQPVIAHDIRTDPRFAPWRDEALKRGYVSAIALPLIADAKTLGVLVLYRDQPDSLADEEVKLLMEMAGDLAFGMQAFRTRAAHRQIEETLQEREARLRLITDNSPDAIIMIDEESIIRFANPAAETIFGYHVAELINQTITMLMPEQFRERHLTAVQHYLATGQRRLNSWQNIEVYGRHRSGREIPLEVSYGEFRQGDASFFIGVLRDITERKQLEEQLRQRAEELETLMEVAPAAIWVAHDPHGDVITGNQWANAFYEAQPGENVSANVVAMRRFFEDGHELSAAELPMQVAAAQDIDIRNREVEVLTPSGKRYTLIGNASPLRSATGEVRGSIAVFIDITERKQAEAKLRESEAFLRTVIDTVPNFIGVKDWESRFVLANRALAEVYGTIPEGLIGKSDADFNPNVEEVEWFHRDDQEVIRTRKPKYIPEEKVTDSTGRVRWLTTVKVPLIEPDGSCSKLLLATHDITDRKRTEDILKRERAYLASAIELLPFPILFIAPTRKVILQNRASLNLLHEPDSHLWWGIQLQHPQTHVSIPQEEWPIMHALRGEAMPTTEWLMVLPDGREVPILLQGTPIYVDHEFVAAVIAFHDISDLKAADYAKNQFLMVLSHELKTPLTNIIGWVQLAEGAPDMMSEALKTIQRNAQEQRTMLERLLILSRILTGRLDLRPQHIDLWQMAIAEIDAVRAQADTHGVTLATYPPTGPLPIDADPNLIRRAIGEVVDNALTFTPAGGTVTVTGGQEDNMAVLTVQDTGRGFAPEQQRLLMHPFQQLQRLEEYGGVGIGLALVKGIVEKHGGQIQIMSPGTDQGSTTMLRLPLATHEGEQGDA